MTPTIALGSGEAAETPHSTETVAEAVLIFVVQPSYQPA
jgi:hypothetical protein